MKDSLMLEATKVIFSGDDPNGNSERHKDDFYELVIFLKDGRTLLVWGCPSCGMLRQQERLPLK